MKPCLFSSHQPKMLVSLGSDHGHAAVITDLLSRLKEACKNDILH